MILHDLGFITFFYFWLFVAFLCSIIFLKIPFLLLGYLGLLELQNLESCSNVIL